MSGEILGLHHIKIPVSDLVRSRAWYERVFDLEPVMEFRDDEDGVVRGVVYRSKGDLAFSLRGVASVGATGPGLFSDHLICDVREIFGGGDEFGPSEPSD